GTQSVAYSALLFRRQGLCGLPLFAFFKGCRRPEVWMAMRTQIRIVAGSLRGRRLTIQVSPNLRPTPQRVREALFSLLGNAVPERPFFDIFAGTGVIGMEALSRGASSATFVERDFGLIREVERHLRQFGVF